MKRSAIIGLAMLLGLASLPHAQARSLQMVPLSREAKDLAAQLSPECNQGVKLLYPSSATIVVGWDEDSLTRPSPKEYQLASAGRLCLGHVATDGTLKPLLLAGGPGGNPYRLLIG